MFAPEYPIRGLKINGDWKYSSLSLKDVEALNTTFFAQAMTLFSDWKVFKTLPHGRGTMHERATVIEALKILEEEANAWDRYEMEKNKKA